MYAAQTLQQISTIMESIELPQPPKVTDPRACPRCGRILIKGRYMHVKHCKG